MDLRGRGALVTGGSGDLGTAISLALARAGCSVAVAYVGNRRGADETVATVEALGCAAMAVQLDQADPAAIDPAVGAAADALGRLDVLVNNAAWNIGIPFAELDRLTVDVWDRMFDTNVRGPFLLARAAATHMRKTGGGRNRGPGTPAAVKARRSRRHRSGCARGCGRNSRSRQGCRRTPGWRCGCPCEWRLPTIRRRAG